MIYTPQEYRLYIYIYLYIYIPICIQALYIYVYIYMYIAVCIYFVMLSYHLAQIGEPHQRIYQCQYKPHILSAPTQPVGTGDIGLCSIDTLLGCGWGAGHLLDTFAQLLSQFSGRYIHNGNCMLLCVLSINVFVYIIYMLLSDCVPCRWKCDYQGRV